MTTPLTVQEIHHSPKIVRHNGEIIDPTSNIKENHMPTKLLTPSETIERKDLIIALSICDSRSEDELMHAVALVQDLQEGETITRGYYVKKQEVVGQVVTILEQSRTGLCTDFVSIDALTNRSENHQLVIDGEIVLVPRHAFIIISSGTGTPSRLGDIKYPTTSS